jgi:putative MATE family efflux protein
MNDLTVGKPFSVIWRFSLPLLLSMALQQFYNLADSMIVGRFTGEAGLAAIGAAYPITLIYIAIATGASMGCSVVIAQLFGGKRMADLKTAITTAIAALLTLGIILGGAGILLARPILSLLSTQEAVLDTAAAYLAIYAFGVIGNFVYNTATSIFTGLGDSKRPLYFLLVSSLLNVVLDLIAVGPLNMGVAGAAWATAISQFVSAILSVTVLMKKSRKELELPSDAPHFSGKLLEEMCRFSIPAIIQQCCVAFSHTILQRLVNSYGVTFMAGYEAASKIHNFVYMCFNTIGTALSSFAAQNYAAKKPDRVRQGCNSSVGIIFGFTVIALLILQLFPAKLIGLFVDASENPGVIEVGKAYLRIISPDYLLICFVIAGGGLLRGVGRVKDFLLVTLLDFAIRISMSFLLSLVVLNSYTGMFWAWYFGTAVDLAILLVLYYRMLHGGILDTKQKVS